MTPRRTRLAAALLLLLAGCAVPGGALDPAKLTPREVLYALEISYTKAADAIVALAPSLPAAAKPGLLQAWRGAGAALDAADAALLRPAASPDDVAAAIAAAQAALTALEAAIIANGGQIHG